MVMFRKTAKATFSDEEIGEIRNLDILHTTIHSMTLTTIKITQETRRKLRVLAAKLDLSYDEVISKLLGENTLVREGVNE